MNQCDLFIINSEEEYNVMAYNQDVADRLRKALVDVSGIKEQEKMGGVSFMLHGKLLVRAHSDGNMMLRCEPDLTDELLQKKGVKRFEMKNKPLMNGWLLITAEGLESKNDLDSWIGIALEFNKKLQK